MVNNLPKSVKIGPNVPNIESTATKFGQCRPTLLRFGLNWADLGEQMANTCQIRLKMCKSRPKLVNIGLDLAIMGPTT